MVVTNAENAVFGPAINARAGLIMREVLPGVAVRAVVFANGAPGTLSQVRTPALPVFDARFSFVKPLLLDGR